MEPRILTPEQFLLTLLVKLAAMAVLATMLARFRRFRHILIFERRGWVDRLVFTLSLGVPLMAGVTSRVILKYDAADLTLEGAFLAGLHRRSVHRRARRPAGRNASRSSPASSSRCPSPSAAALPAAACARRARRKRSGSSRRSSSSTCRKHVWQMLRKLEPNWQLVLLLAPVALELLRQALGTRFGAERLFYLGSPSPWMTLVVVLATVVAVATPIKIWNSARIEHRLQEQEKLLLAAKIEALKSQINPHFLFNTLTSISSLIRSQPDTARTLIIKLSALLRRLLRSHQHFVTLREELESIDEYLDIEVVRFGPKLRVRKDIGPDTLDIVVPSMILQPLVENSIKHGLARKVGPGVDHDPEPSRERPRGHRGRGRRDGVRARPAGPADVERHRTGQRPRAAARDLRRPRTS